jgi:anti-sigma-K factor RskA
VSEHPETRDLLGPFVMGDLDPAEERAVEEHLEDCDSCSEEAESLRLVHGHMLEFAATSEAPPRHLKDRAVAGLPAPSTRRAVPAWAAAAAAVLLVALGLAIGPSLLGSQEVAAATLEPMGEAPDAGAEVNVRGAGENLEVRVDAWGLPKCEEEEYYELWFVEESGEHVSAGSFTVDESGDAELDLTAPQFATSYQRIGVTVERDKDPRPSGVMMMGGELRGS